MEIAHRLEPYWRLNRRSPRPGLAPKNATSASQFSAYAAFCENVLKFAEMKPPELATRSRVLSRLLETGEWMLTHAVDSLAEKKKAKNKKKGGQRIKNLSDSSSGEEDSSDEDSGDKNPGNKDSGNKNSNNKDSSDSDDSSNDGSSSSSSDVDDDEDDDEDEEEDEDADEEDQLMAEISAALEKLQAAGNYLRAESRRLKHEVPFCSLPPPSAKWLRSADRLLDRFARINWRLRGAGRATAAAPTKQLLAAQLLRGSMVRGTLQEAARLWEELNGQLIGARTLARYRERQHLKVAEAKAKAAARREDVEKAFTVEKSLEAAELVGATDRKLAQLGEMLVALEAKLGYQPPGWAEDVVRMGRQLTTVKWLPSRKLPEVLRLPVYKSVVENADRLMATVKELLDRPVVVVVVEQDIEEVEEVENEEEEMEE